MIPVFRETEDANLAIQIGLVWCFFEAMILVVGSFLGDLLRKLIPRTVLLSCLSGLGLLLLAMNPMLQSFETPIVAFVVLVIILSTGLENHRSLRKFLQGFTACFWDCSCVGVWLTES